jgi:chromosome segregation ATPase
LEDLRREQADVQGQLARLNRKVDEFEVQRAEATEAIERSRAVCEEIKFFTKQEAHRLKGKRFCLLTERQRRTDTTLKRQPNLTPFKTYKPGVSNSWTVL